MNNLFKYSKLLFNTTPSSPDGMKEAEQGQKTTSTSPEKTDLVQPRKIMEGINERVDKTLGGLTIEEIDRRIDEKIRSGAVKGDKGDKGPPGPKGDALKFEDLTDDQKSQLKGERGLMPDFGALDEDQKKKLKQLMIDLGFGGTDTGLGGTDTATKNRLDELDKRIKNLQKLTDDYVDSDAHNKDQLNLLERNYKALQQEINRLAKRQPVKAPVKPNPVARTPRPAPPRSKPVIDIKKPLPAEPEGIPATVIEQPKEAENEKDIAATKRLREKLTIQVELLLTELNSANIIDVNKKLKLLSRIENFKLRLNNKEILDVNGRKNLSSTFLRLKKVVIKIIYELNKTEDYTKTVPEIKIPNQMKKSPETIVDKEEYTKTPNPIPGKKKPETSEEIKKDDAADAKETPPPGEITNPESTNK